MNFNPYNTPYGRLSTSDRRASSPSWFGVIATLVVLIVVGNIGFAFYSMSHTGTMTCMVTGKDRVQGSDGKSDMRVYTRECGTLRVGDSILDGKFSSADTYGALRTDTQYEFTTRGVRVPFLNSFPNIIEVRPAR